MWGKRESESMCAGKERECGERVRERERERVCGERERESECVGKE